MFQVVKVQSSAPKHPLSSENKTLTSGLGKKLSHQSNTNGPFSLPANNSIEMTLKFKPKPRNGLGGRLKMRKFESHSTVVIIPFLLSLNNILY
mgnify:CR=1 FL=1